MNKHEQVMQQLGCDDLNELIDPKFLREFGLAMPGQYGMVCQNVKDRLPISKRWVQVLLCMRS